MNLPAPDIRNWSIKNKLKAVIILTSLAVLLVLFLVFVVNQRNFLRSSLLQEMDVLSRNMATNCAAAVIFGDRTTAGETLESLQANPQVIACIIYDTKKQVFSSYSNRQANSSSMDYPTALLLDAGHLFSGRHLDIVQTIGHGREHLGILFLRADLDKIETILMRYISLGFLGLGGAFILAWILADRLQGVISKPIEQLATAMRAVSKERNYRRRVEMDRQDELGSLIEDFNEMLVQIELRDRELRSKQNRLDYLAHHDTLTDLPNRLLFHDRLHHAITMARRTQQKLALLFLDLDRFKNINDSLGHEVGDRVLQQAASRLLNIMRKSDTLARLGGDEFVIALEQDTNTREVSIVAQKILDTLSGPFHINASELYITASIGISLFPDNGVTVENLMKAADVAMYKAKELGRNNFQFYTEDMNKRAQEALFLENNLRKAIDNRELALYYQPQVEISTGKVTGMEALVRWHHPEFGVISPNKFIPMAEETGLILPLGKWVINTACQQAFAWQQAGYPPWKVAVNISPRQFRHGDLADSVSKALRKSGLAAQWLELEITENLLVEDVEHTIDLMKTLNGMGVSLAIDDFGTGYSSMSYLHRFPLAKLKIDQSFVQNIGSSAGNHAIVEAIIALAHALNLEVIAEGIENQTQLAFLEEQGCRYGQGFYFSKPLPSDAIAQFMLKFQQSHTLSATPKIRP